MTSEGVATRLARLDLGFRSERRRRFGPVISPFDGWDIILLLFVADAEGRRLTVRDVIDEFGEEAEAGKRRIAYLARAGIVVADASGSAEEVVTLAPETITQVEDMIERAWALIDAI